jgi:hypothetical protein
MFTYSGVYFLVVLTLGVLIPSLRCARVCFGGAGGGGAFGGGGCKPVIASHPAARCLDLCV